MDVSTLTKVRLQIQADVALALGFDGGDDWWTYVMLGRDEWAINIWDGCVWGDGSEGDGLTITAYSCHEDGVDTSDWVQLRIRTIPAFLASVRLTIKGLLCDKT